MDAITLNVRGNRRITIESETPIKISIEPLPTPETDGAPIVPFPTPDDSSWGRPDESEFNPR